MWVYFLFDDLIFWKRDQISQDKKFRKHQPKIGEKIKFLILKFSIYQKLHHLSFTIVSKRTTKNDSKFGITIKKSYQLLLNIIYKHHCKLT